MTTAVQNLLTAKTTSDSGHAARAAKAAANGMTIEQLAASEIALGSKTVCGDAACLSVFQSRDLAIAAFDRIAAIPETDAGSCYIPCAKLVAAILA